jgi:Tol biopolymer transport system component
MSSTIAKGFPMFRTLGVIVLAVAFTATGCATGSNGRSPLPSATNARPALREIAFGRFDNEAHTLGEIVIENSDGTKERTLLSPPTGSVDETPDWSPDGSQLVFVRWTPQTEQVFGAAADGSSLRALTAIAAGSGASIGGLDEHPVYSPDGSKIAYIHISGDKQNDVRQHEDVWIMDSDGSSETDVTHLPDYAGELDGVQWSPDGKDLVYSAFNDTPGAGLYGGALFTIRADGTNNHRLTAWRLNAGGVPDWSSVTNVIAFRAVTDIEPGFGNIYTIRPDGQGLKQVTRFSETAVSSKVSVSVDGSWLLFAKGEQKAIFIERIDGSSLRAVGTSKYYDSAPDWGPDA